MESKTIEATAKIKKALDAYRAAKKELETCEARKLELAKQLVSLMGDCDTITLRGIPVCTYKQTKERKFFDADAFKKQYPKLAEQFSYEKEGYFLLKTF